jgi:hypothetical protein
VAFGGVGDCAVLIVIEPALKLDIEGDKVAAVLVAADQLGAGL